MVEKSFKLSQFFQSGFFPEVKAYFQFLYNYFRKRGYVWFAKFEVGKDVIVDLLYKRRGKYTRPFLHFGTIALVFLVITFGPFILEQQKKEEGQPAGSGSPLVINSAYSSSTDLSTTESDLVKSYRGGEVETYTVKSGDTLSSIAQTYGLNTNTIVWENTLDPKVAVKPGRSEERRVGKE